MKESSSEVRTGLILWLDVVDDEPGVCCCRIPAGDDCSGGLEANESEGLRVRVRSTDTCPMVVGWVCDKA